MSQSQAPSASPPTPDAVGTGDTVKKQKAGTVVKDVEMADGTRRVFRVYPVGIHNINKFARSVSKGMKSIASLDILKKDVSLASIDADTIKSLITLGVEIIVEDMMDLVVSCVKPPIDDEANPVPHWELPKILEAWLIQNFGEERKIRPWVQAIETMVLRTTGNRVPLWETLSRYLSPAAIRDAISSMNTSTGSGDTGSHTEDGQSPNSGTGSESADDNSTGGGQSS